MIYTERMKGRHFCLNCMKEFEEIIKTYIITPFHRDDREFELCDDCAGMLSEMLREEC